MKNRNRIEIKEDFRLPGTDVILESGDRIEVLKEELLGDYSALLKEMEAAAKSPTEKKVTKSWKEYKDSEVGSASSGGYKYSYAGYVYSNLASLKKDVAGVLSSINKNRAKTKQEELQTQIKEMKEGKLALSFASASNTDTIYILFEEEITHALSVREYRRKIFDIQDDLDVEVVPFDPVYVTVTVSGI